MKIAGMMQETNFASGAPSGWSRRLLKSYATSRGLRREPSRKAGGIASRGISALLLLFIMLVGLAGCSTEKERPPKIANLVYSMLQTPVAEGGIATVTGTFNIIHENGETESVTTVVHDAQGNEVAKGTIPLSEAALRTSETLAFGVDTSTSKKGMYTFQVYVTDDKGRLSNRLTGTIEVTDLF